MTSSSDELRLIAFGQRVRQHRETLQISMRRLASESGISPSYLSAIESGRNPATGRPPEPSARVVERLCSALDLPRTIFTSDFDEDHHGSCSDNHLLLYRMDERRDGLGAYLREMTDSSLDQWICIADPSAPGADGDLVTLHWPYGSDPYPDGFLVADRIGEALGREVAARKDEMPAGDYGLAIADCSSVMRWVVNPDAEIDYEDLWVEQSTAALTQAISRAPRSNVCVYHQRDFAALAERIDPLDTLLRLFQVHEHSFTVDPDGKLRSDAEAVHLALADQRPGDVSSSAWRKITKAAARALV